MAKKIKVSITLDEDIVEWIDGVAKGLNMSRSEFLNMILSGGRDSAEMVDRVIDKWFDQKTAEIDQKKAEVKAKLEILAR